MHHPQALAIHARRCSSSKNILHIPHSDVYRFGDSDRSSPLFRGIQWSVKEGENWAVVGTGSGEKTALFQTLLGQYRISPLPPGGLFPFLTSSNSPRDPHNCISLVSFAHRPRSAGGVFYDYTARYGAVRDEDRLTLRETMFSSVTPDEVDEHLFDNLAKCLGLIPLLELPFIALSNGQTRRARIVKALLRKPELLLLDEPLTGLDVESRPTLLNLLHSLHKNRSPRIILGLRSQDPMPEWITHIARVGEGKLTTGHESDIKSFIEGGRTYHSTAVPMNRETAAAPKRAILAEIKNVKVQYKDRKVLDGINWTIREGDRWHLQGANGSGKSTLLSLLTGDHPQSFTQSSVSSLTLFDKPRSQIPTTKLRTLIGVVSPELANAFPRRAGMKVWEAIGTGFDGVFVGVGRNGLGVMRDDRTMEWKESRLREVLDRLGPATWDESSDVEDRRKLSDAFAARDFVDLSAGEQSVVLLMRALVGRPPLVLLDEVWNGMDDRMIRAAHRYLRAGGGVDDSQAVVVISHWEDEVPWDTKDGAKRIKLENGRSTILKL